MAEKFVPIAGYEGLYEVSNLGNVKSLNYLHTGKERILSPGFNKEYLFVNLYKDKKDKKYKIHRLVAEAFIPNPNEYPCINHKDCNKLNNRSDNLEWCTNQYNIEYSCAKSIYCVELNKSFPSTMEAYRITGINQGNIVSCLKGKRKSAGGYHWTYA